MNYDNRTATAAISSSRTALGNEPSEPTMLGTANELLNYVSTLEQHAYQLRCALFGAAPECASEKRDSPSTLQDILRDACTRSASLCGDLQTIKSRLGLGL